MVWGGLGGAWEVLGCSRGIGWKGFWKEKLAKKYAAQVGNKWAVTKCDKGLCRAGRASHRKKQQYTHNNCML